MSAALVNELYPKFMSNGRFADMCGETPDDVTISDLVYSKFKIKMEVNNDFHHQHSRNYKLPFFAPQLISSSAITLYGFDNLPKLHSILSLDTAFGEQSRHGDSRKSRHGDHAPATVTPKQWWRQLAELTVVPRRGSKSKQMNLGFNFCSRVSPPPEGCVVNVRAFQIVDGFSLWCILLFPGWLRWPSRVRSLFFPLGILLANMPHSL